MNATGFFKAEPRKLDQLLDAREHAVTLFRDVLDQLRNIDPNEVTLSDPESGKTIGMLMHELAFLIEDRPEGEESALDEDRQHDLERSIQLYTEALPFREGNLKAMTLSRRANSYRKILLLSEGVSDLTEAVAIYLENPDGQRLNILERDINTCLLYTSPSPRDS